MEFFLLELQLNIQCEIEAVIVYECETGLKETLTSAEEGGLAVLF